MMLNLLMIVVLFFPITIFAESIPISESNKTENVIFDSIDNLHEKISDIDRSQTTISDKIEKIDSKLAIIEKHTHDHDEHGRYDAYIGIVIGIIFGLIGWVLGVMQLLPMQKKSKHEKQTKKQIITDLLKWLPALQIMMNNIEKLKNLPDFQQYVMEKDEFTRLLENIASNGKGILDYDLLEKINSVLFVARRHPYQDQNSYVFTNCTKIASDIERLIIQLKKL